MYHLILNTDHEKRVHFVVLLFWVLYINNLARVSSAWECTDTH